MDELKRRALARLPMTAGDVRIMYAVGTPPMKSLCESHERLRAELEGTTALLRDAEAEVRRVRELIERDRTGLAAALAEVRRTCRGWGWLSSPDEWGFHEHGQHTVATLRDEIGDCLGEIDRKAEDALRASGSLVSDAFHGEVRDGTA
jgi:hypothetical protein